MKGVFIITILCGFLINLSYQLACTTINNNDQVAGKMLRIPDNAQNPVEIANYSCVYTIKPPSPTVYAQITITQELAGIDDVITVTDWQKKTTKYVSTSAHTNDIYVFPGTATILNVSVGDSIGSKLLITISYVQLPTPTQVTLQKNSRLLSAFMLSDIQQKPVTVMTDEPILLILARSGHIVDRFENYYVLDGDFSSYKTISSLQDLSASHFNFQSTSNKLTFVGFDNQTQFSSIIVTPSSETSGYTKYAGITVGGSASMKVSLSNGQKAAVVVVAKDADQLVLTSLVRDTSPNCRIRCQTGAPNSASLQLIDFTSDYASVPQLFPYKYFSFVTENCDATLYFSTKIPAMYYNLDGPKNGFIFSPSYFAPGVRADFNITYTYTGTDKLQYSVDVDPITVNSKGDELDVNIYDESWKKTSSAVLTGNQEGTRSRAFGKYLNVKMTGMGTARLRYMLTASASVFNNIFLLVAVVAFWISNF